MLHMFSKLTCWFLLGLWCESNMRLRQLMIPLLSVFLCIMVDFIEFVFTLDWFTEPKEL